ESAGKALLALFLESLDLLILPIVVAGGHGHEQPFHAAVLLTTEDPQTLVELLEILAGSQPVVERAQEEVLQASDGEAQCREAQLVREGIPLGEREGTQ